MLVAALAAGRWRAAKRPTRFRARRTASPTFRATGPNLTYTPYERPKELADKAVLHREGSNRGVQQSGRRFAEPGGPLREQRLRRDAGADGRAAEPPHVARDRSARRPHPADDARGAEARGRACRSGARRRTAARGRGATTARTVWCVFHDRAVPSVIAPYGSNYHIVQSKD